MVVAPFAQAKQEGQSLDGAEIEPDIGEIRAVHAANDHQIAAAVLVEGREHLADLAPFDPGVGKALDLLPRLAADGDDVQGKPPRRRRLGQHAGKRTPPGYDTEPAFDLFSVTHLRRAAIIGSALRHCSVRRTSGPIES